MARRPHKRKCSMTLPGGMCCVNFFVFSKGSLEEAALRLMGEDLVAEVILRGWGLKSEPVACDFFVFSSGSLGLDPAIFSFVAGEDLEAEVTFCKPIGFGGFANFFVFSSGSLAFALRIAAARSKVAINRARLSPPAKPTPAPPTPPHRSKRGLFKLCTSIYQSLLTSQVCRGGGVGGGAGGGCSGGGFALKSHLGAATKIIGAEISTHSQKDRNDVYRKASWVATP